LVELSGAENAARWWVESAAYDVLPEKGVCGVLVE
jgi:hypothetical protein